jgi:hypothetical protein
LAERVQTLNYSAHAIAELSAEARQIERRAPESAAITYRVIEALRASEKFLLPNRGELLDPYAIGPGHLELTRLPYPIVALEAPWEGVTGPLRSDVANIDLQPSTRRIALCWEAGADFEVIPGCNEVLEHFPKGGVFVIPISWMNGLRRWKLGLGGIFLPHGVAAPGQLASASRAVRDGLVELGLARTTALEGRAEPFELQPELCAAAEARLGSHDRLVSHILWDARDEVMMLIQACSVLNCANVAVAEVSPSAALNKQRQRAGKQPFFAYKVLDVTDERRSAGPAGAGGHASPRTHLRRGHLRTLQDQRRVYVRPAIVNPQSGAGVVVKDYSLRSGSAGA